MGDWTGQAQTAFAAAQGDLSTRLAVAGTALGEAAYALRGHADILEYSQTRARQLARQWRTAPCVPATGLLPTLAPEQIRAQAELERLRVDVNAAARAAAAVVEAATRDAPIDPTFWNQVGYHLSEFGQGAWGAVRDLGILVWEQNSFRFLWDPYGAVEAKRSLIEGLWTSLHDPKQFAKDLIDWDTWHTSPARALGTLAPDAIIAIFTAGAGAAAVRGARAGATISTRAAVTGAVRSGTRSLVQNSALVSASRSLSQSVSGFWNGRMLASGLPSDAGQIRFWPVTPDASARRLLQVDEIAKRFPDKALRVEVSGQRLGWNKELHRPAPNSVYVVDGRNVYVTDHLGRVDHVEGRWEPTNSVDAKASRNNYQQRIAGGTDRLPDDVGGHLIAASGGGAGEGINLVPLHKLINGGGGDYGGMEAQIRSIAAANPGAHIDLRIDLEYPTDSLRPDSMDIDVLVDGQKAGKVLFEQ
ncbi:DNA/RNA non-specific endonuclease [Cellulomonas cellasea]|nr:DNA/RNA non-specific endonuclease [Cellulomonas cellasea]MDM8085134.1 DNA/RNA non-specific endonuclease [Cellulomonas cellasea]